MVASGVITTETTPLRGESRGVGGRQIRQISFSQIEPSELDQVFEGQEVIVVTLNDLNETIDPKFISAIRAILKHRKICAFSASGWDADPRPISEIPEARRLFHIAATQYGVLGLIEDKFRLGILPTTAVTEAARALQGSVPRSTLEQEIDEFVACCIGQYLYQAQLGKSVFTIDLNQKERLIDTSRRVYRELYHDLL